MELAAGVLLSARPSPAVKLSGASRRRARLASVRSVLAAADLAAGTQRGIKTAAAVREGGEQAEDRWCRPLIWGSQSLGRPPGRFCFFVVGSDAARQRLRARSSSAPMVGVPGGWLLRRPRRWRGGVLGNLEVEDGEWLRCCSSFFPLCSFFPCVSMCTVILLV